MAEHGPCRHLPKKKVQLTVGGGGTNAVCDNNRNENVSPGRSRASALGVKGQHAFCLPGSTVLQRLLRARLQPVSGRLLEPLLGKWTGDEHSP